MAETGSTQNKIIFRMSSAGRCPRALSAQLLNMEAEEKPKWLETTANEGIWHEERIADREMAFNRQREIWLDFPSFKLVGHIDGVVPWDTDNPRVLLEVKSMSQFEFDRWMRGRFNEFPNYASQITCYMEATGLDKCLYIVKNRNSGHEDRQVLEEKPVFMTEIIGKLTDVTNHVISNQLVPREFDSSNIECKRCEYKKLCIPEPEELTPMQQADLESSAEEWRKGKRLVEQGQALMNIAKQSFEEHTKATNQTKWQFQGLAIQIVHYKEQIAYRNAELTKLFTTEQLAPAAYIREASDQLRIIDLKAKGEDND